MVHLDSALESITHEITNCNYQGLIVKMLHFTDEKPCSYFSVKGKSGLIPALYLKIFLKLQTSSHSSFL